MNDPLASPRVKGLLWTGFLLVLALTFSLYLQPGFMLDLGAFLALCGFG